ncbi:hypothetical protein FF38_12768 [Lucilia cuprina]|uniref:PH domain-containing protein n=1 Tax=Lucilia cuprina TaxID=7375 RepID=A0A0L0CJ41_LUCCU|nr:Pleckstrin like proteiny-like domain family B member 2 [Lucilia cuprina]KAI8130736.1 Pleckstrin like proteiny-like domain family B member 2 [Lucilia cuprina]KNC31494.1 hypothetical protein FF38_12768 [Lucilia cuprina]
MSLTKKDPSFCVAANDPHLVSLGGGRLSTAVTIHNIPIGDTTIGSSTRCSISLNGTGIRPLHCTIYRSEENEVTLVPERDARILIDGHKIDDEVNLTQGAMITVGKSYYLRFNNPAEAQQIRTAMGSNERISMPQIDFAQERQRHSAKSCNSTGTSSSGEVTTFQIDSFYETTIQSSLRKENGQDGNYVKSAVNAYNNLAPIDINGLQCPKVFTADLVTVNMPAKDVLGQKYTKFAKNLAEHHRNEKNLNNAWHNNQNQMNNSRNNGNIYDNVPALKVNNQEPNSRNAEYLTKLKHANETHRQAVNAYDRYPKLGNMQIFPMTTVNNEINIQTSNKLQINSPEHNGNITLDEKEHLDDMLKICSEYTDRQNQNSSNCGSMSSSPIVQNRIKTNGSLPRDKKSPFQHDLSSSSLMQQSFEGSFNNLSINNSELSGNNSYSTGYENVRIVGQNRVELNGQLVGSPKSGYENVVIGKYIPQSPRTKIRTNCMSPKKEQSFGSIFSSQKPEPQTLNNSKSTKQQEYDDLLKTFGEKLQQEMQNIEECSRYQPPQPTTYATPQHRSNKNINNLKLNLKPPSSLQNSPKPNKKPAPAPRTLLKSGNSSTGGSLPHLAGVSHSQAVADEKEQLRKSELDSLTLSKQELENILDMLQDKIHRLEAQRNATRVMEENQQAKLKQSTEMKMDQVKKLKDMLKQKPNNECLKEELKNISESLDNDRKQFEDLEFQYLEEESEWHAYHEELKTEEKMLIQQIEEKEKEIQNLQSPTNKTAAPQNNNNNHKASDITNSPRNKTNKLNSSLLQDSSLNKPYDIGEAIGIMSQSLFGSAEMLCPKRNNDNDIMSKSVNENMFFNNKIEFGSSTTTATSSTPKRQPQLQIVNIDDSQLTASYKQESISKSCESFTQAVRCNLSLGSDDFEVNPLEKRIPSQDDIDRISKVTTDAPISSQGATTKIFDSIKEIERNRQLLLAQQGHHVIEHERQKMNDLKKKIHSEARAQYISIFNRNNTDGINTESESQSSTTQRSAQKTQQQKEQHQKEQQENHPLMDKENQPNVEKILLATTKNSQNSNNKNDDESLGQQRHSQPEFTTTQHHYDDEPKRHSANSRPLSEANSDIEPLGHQNSSKSNMELSTNTAYALEKRLSSNSNDGSNSMLGSQKLRNKDSSDANERKRVLPKHQRPLTRYLPIFSPDLDLRQHIESAGHQIALCPHVFVDSNSCRGYLHKLGATFHGWSKRWFVLDRQRNAFIYYSDKLERKPRGGAYFSTIDEVYLDHLNISKSGRPHCTFIVKTKKRSYQLQAASDAAARIWIDAIITGAQGNLDY